MFKKNGDTAEAIKPVENEDIRFLLRPRAANLNANLIASSICIKRKHIYNLIQFGFLVNNITGRLAAIDNETQMCFDAVNN